MKPQRTPQKSKLPQPGELIADWPRATGTSARGITTAQQKQPPGARAQNSARNKMKNNKLTGANTRLERNVQSWANSKADDYQDGVAGVLKDLFYGGCSSGMVNHLIYTTDCVKFYKTHRREISAILKETMDKTGEYDLSKLFGNTKAMTWDAEDPLAQEDGNRNILAWFGFEESARNLAERNGIKI
jgi:hypothetical protein